MQTRAGYPVKRNMPGLKHQLVENLCRVREEWLAGAGVTNARGSTATARC